MRGRPVLWGSALLLLASTALAQTWSDDARLWSLRQKGRPAQSPAMQPAQVVPDNGRITLVYWRYRLIKPAPSRLKVTLCSPRRCQELPGERGGTRAFAGESAQGPFWFYLFVPGKGPLKPPVRMLYRQLIVNYS